MYRIGRLPRLVKETKAGARGLHDGRRPEQAREAYPSEPPGIGRAHQFAVACGVRHYAAHPRARIEGTAAWIVEGAVDVVVADALPLG
jgi:hypothetical protein